MNRIHFLPAGIVAVAFAALLAAGCATDGAFQAGKRLMAEKRWEEALVQLEIAAAEDEKDLGRRTALVEARSRAVAELLAQANSEREQNRLPEAERAFRRVLAIDRSNERAKFGLKIVTDERKRSALVEESEKLFRKGNLDEAEKKINALLLETPKNPRALDLKERIREKRAKPALAAPPVLKPTDTKPISIEFRDANLKMVFDVLSRTSGINFVLDKDIRPDTKTTVFLKNAPLEEAIDSLLATNQLAKKVMNENTVFIYPNTPQKLKEYQDLVIRNFFLANSDPKQVMNLLRTILKVRDVYIDERRNAVVIRDTEEAVRLAEKLVAAHDQAEPEVMLEVEVIEVKRSKLNELGLQFPEKIALGVASPITLQALKDANSSAVNVAGLDPTVTINLKKTLSDANLLANPRIRVRNREKAKIHVGDRVPVVTSTISGTTAITTETVTYLDIGLRLEVEPQILLDDDVVIKTSLEVSSIAREFKNDKTGNTVFQVGTRTASTTLSLKDNETQVLAGLISDSERLSTSRLPGLGDIPILGRLFSSEKTDQEKTEIVLSITPRVIRNLERPEAALAEYWSGPETSLRSGLPAPAAPGVAPTPAPARAPAPASRPFAPTPSAPAVVLPATETTAPAPGTAPAPSPAAPSTPPAPPTTSTPPAPAAPESQPPIYFQPPPGVGSGG